MQPDRGFWHGKPVSVTGGTGFLGYHLVRQLLDLGAAVRILALPPSPHHPLLRETRIHCHFGDMRDSSLVRKALAGAAVVFHTAGIVSASGREPERMQEVHVLGTRNVLQAMPAGARLVHSSSVVAVGASWVPQSLTEDSVFNLHDFAVDYVFAKRAAEELVQKAARSHDVVITNPAYLVGPEDLESSLMGRLCLRFWKGRFPVVPSGGLNVADVRDVATGHLLAAERGRRGRRYILGGENCTFRQFLELLAEVAGLRPRRLPSLPTYAWHALAGLAECRAALTNREAFPSFEHVRIHRLFWFYRSERAERELGYHCRPLRDSLMDSYRWHRANGLTLPRGFGRWLLRAA